MILRIECTIPGLDANWIEVTDAWTRNDLRDLITLKGEPFMMFWTRKVTACNVVAVDGSALTTAVDVAAHWDELDFRLPGFLSNALLEATDYLLTLGEAPKRLLCDGVAVVAKTNQTPSPPTAAD